MRHIEGGRCRTARSVSIAVLALSLLLVIITTGCGSESSGIVIRPGGAPVASPTSTAANSPVTQGRDVASDDATAADGAPTDLEGFVDQFGYPTDATFARLRIPVLSVDAWVAPRSVGADGQMPLPAGPADVAWYDLSTWPGLGGAPGEGGNAVFAGHVDYSAYVPYADTVYRGKGVFESLAQLVEGDIIELEYGGEVLRYAVVSNRQLSAAPGATDWAAVWSDGGADAVTLYTCGGDFDPVAQTYNDRVVVRAERVS